MLARPRNQPENSSRGGTYEQQHKHPLQDAETSECQQDGIPGEYWIAHERVGKGQIRCDVLRGKDQCPRVSEEAATNRQAHSDDGQTFQKKPLCPGSSRSEKLRSLPPGPAKVPPAHFRDIKSARRGCRVPQGTRGHFLREVSTGVQQSDRRHSAWGNVPLLSEVREARGSFLASQPSRPPGLEAPRPPHVWCIWTVLIWGDRPLRSKTYVTNDTVELYCPWCESLPFTTTALSLGDLTERVFNFSCRDQSDRGDKVGRTLSNHWWHTRHSTADRPSTPLWVPKHGRRKSTETNGSRTAACFDTSGIIDSMDRSNLLS